MFNLLQSLKLWSSLLLVTTAPFNVACHNLDAQHATPKAAYNNATVASQHTVYSQSYVVHGKRYHVIKNARGYREKGIASWYSNSLHNRRTSSGELYKTTKLTAAHKTLPLMSRVKVTNLVNGKTVVVRINDRGPFIQNRSIDLSRAAAKELGLLQKGFEMVEIVTLDSPSILENTHTSGRSSTQRHLSGRSHSNNAKKFVAHSMEQITID